MRSMRQIHLAHLNDKYFKGNAVYAPWGLSPCVTSAAGCGGGAYTVAAIYKQGGMRNVSISPYSERHDVVVDPYSVSCPLLAAMGMGGVGVKNLINGLAPKRPCILVIKRKK